MANTTTRVPESTNNAIAGFFRDESKAEKAIDELKHAAFSNSAIGVATAHEEGKVGNFWDRMTSKFGKAGHSEQASDLEQSLRDFGSQSRRPGTLIPK
jgi:hypothetical protein